MQFLSILVLSVFLLSSCSNKITLPMDYKLQFLPDKSAVQDINNLKITYIIPKAITTSSVVHDLNFVNKEWGVDSHREKLLISVDNQTLQVERRTDNGVAGSGRVFKVGINQTNEPTNTVVTLRAESMETYQDGLILPFPLPDFDLKGYLASAVVKYNFELNSEFPMESIRASFNRVLEKSGNNDYILKLSNASVLISIKVDPYRHGSKVIINSKLLKMRPINDIIDVNNIILELKREIQKIVNS